MTSAGPSVSWPQALAWRLERQFLDPVGEASAAQVVARLGAVLALDESLAELALATRSDAVAAGDLARAVAEGSVVTVFAYRGAVHHLSPSDAGIYLALRAAGRQWELPSWVEHYRLTADAWPDFRAAVREALADGPLTLSELGAAVTAHRAYRHLRTVFDDGAKTLLKPLTWQGDMSFGTPRDGRSTFQRLDHNPRWGGIPDLEEAGPRAIRAHLRSYGPATADHVHHWFGSGLSAGRRRLDRWLDGLCDELAVVDVAGTEAYVLVDDVEALLATRASTAVRFLPGHDQWVMGPGTQDERVVPPAHRDLITRKANPVLVGGVVCGTWSRQGDELSVRWLDDSPPPVTAIDGEARRLAGFLDRDLRLLLDPDRN